MSPCFITTQLNKQHHIARENHVIEQTVLNNQGENYVIEQAAVILQPLLSNRLKKKIISTMLQNLKTEVASMGLRPALLKNAKGSGGGDLSGRIGANSAAKQIPPRALDPCSRRRSAAARPTRPFRRRLASEIGERACAVDERDAGSPLFPHLICMSTAVGSPLYMSYGCFSWSLCQGGIGL